MSPLAVLIAKKHLFCNFQIEVTKYQDMLHKVKTIDEQLTDTELIPLIKKEQKYLGIVYKRCKAYCIRFMVNMTNGAMTNDDLEDIYQDAILVLYEKIIGGDFVLTSKIQTYLNSVCRFQLLNKYKVSQKTVAYENNGDEENHASYDDQITDSLDEIEDPKEKQFTAIEKALKKMKAAGGQCYQILTLFWYQKKSMKEIADICNYTDDKNAKHQKSRCQKKLREMASNEIN